MPSVASADKIAWVVAAEMPSVASADKIDGCTWRLLCHSVTRGLAVKALRRSGKVRVRLPTSE